MKLHFGVFA